MLSESKKENSISSQLLFAFIPIEYPLNEVLFEKNEIISEKLDIFISRLKKGTLNNSGYYVFSERIHNNSVDDGGLSSKNLVFDIDISSNEKFIETRHKLILNDILSNDDIEIVNGWSNKILLLFLNNKSNIKQTSLDFSILQSILVYPSVRENKSILKITVYRAQINLDLLEINSLQPFESPEVTIRKLGPRLPLDSSSRIHPDIKTENISIFSSLDEKSSGIDEKDLKVLGTKRFIKMGEETTFELVVNLHEKESIYKMQIIEKTTTLINIIIIGGML